MSPALCMLSPVGFRGGDILQLTPTKAENIIFLSVAHWATQQKHGKNQRGAAPAEHRPVSGIWAARRARAQRGPAQCNTWPSQVVGWAHRAHGSVAQRCPARTTMRRGPAGLPPGDQLLGCLGALAVRDV